VTSTRPESRRRTPVVPNQHGAWGFLILPVLLGIVASGWSWAVVPLVVAWVAAYPFSWAVTGSLTARRPERFHKAVLIWGGVTAAAGVLALTFRPWLVWVLLPFLALYGVSLRFARARNERALVNDLVLIAQCAAMVPTVAGVVSGAGGLALPFDAMTEPAVVALTLVCALALVGSTLHVKSLIRERNDPRYALASRSFAVVCVPAVAAAAAVTGVALWVTAPFVALAARAIWWHDPTWRPARIGVVELAGLVLVVAGAAVSV